MTVLDRLTPEDVRILELERGNVRGHTCKVVVLGDRPAAGATLDRLRAHVEARLPRHPRLRRRILATPLGVARPAWVEDERFDVARHVVAHPAAGELDAEGLRVAVAELMATPLDRERPLWRIDVVERLAGGGAALVVRIHHALADGMTAGHILADVVLDSEPPDSGFSSAPGAPRSAELVALALRDRARDAAAAAGGAARSLASPASWRAGARTLAGLPGVLRRDLRESGESPLDAPAGPTRVVGFVARELEDVRRAAKSLGAGITINDVVLAAIGGGLRSWLEDEGAPIADLRAKVPVSLHHAGESTAASANRDSFMVVDLALDHADPVERLLAISAATRERKRHHDAEEIDSLLHDLAHVSRSLERLAERWAVRPRVFAVNVSNVPGPRGDLSLLGARVDAVHSLAEVANRHALRASVFSAGGMLSFGLCADSAVVPQLTALAGGIEHDLDALVARA